MFLLNLVERLFTLFLIFPAEDFNALHVLNQKQPFCW
jgi:hypothetical protein